MQEVSVHSTYDWWKDIWLPAAGAILIPVAIAFFTWWFGASRAEKQKELQELHDNLNLLLSVCLASIMKIIAYREELIKIHNLETTKEKINFDYALQYISKIYCIRNDFDVIDITKYSSCISVSENYMMGLITVKNSMELLSVRINYRNEKLAKLSNSENETTKNKLMSDFILFDLSTFDDNLRYIERTLLSLYYFVKDTKDLESKIKKLKLDTIKYSAEQKKLFAELEPKYKQELKSNSEEGKK